MAPRRRQRGTRGSGLSKVRIAGLVLAFAGFLVPWAIEFPGLSVEGSRIFSVFLLAIALWVTEAIPLHATAAVVVFLEILLISDKGLLAAPAGFTPPSYSVFFHAFSSPILMLFLGGFFLAEGATKFSLDRGLARVLLRPFGTSPKMVLLGLMLITAAFSMFMSNTATTATLMAVALPVISGLPSKDRLRVALALAIPLAANIGGLATPIGTPPNAITIGALSHAGVQIGFGQWMMMAAPIVVIALGLAWVLLATIYRSDSREIHVNIEGRFDTSWQAKVFYATFAVTVVLWLTEGLHGLQSSIVGFFPVVVLLSTNIFKAADLKQVQWHVLWLVAGGIALGQGVGACGLDRWLVGLLAWDTMPPWLVVASLGLVALAMSTFISNSATANLLIPIALSLSSSSGLSPVLLGGVTAVGCSLAMALPISTPPNAIAISTGAVKTSQMALVGAIIGVFGWILCVSLAPVYWRWLGVLTP
jgi:sodium-dependent dicarboxylate transporter 2/3/5